MLFGYARISTNDQNLDLQIKALIDFGVTDKNIVTDIVSGSASERNKLDNLIERLRKGDTLVVWKLDRLARSVIHFSKTMNAFNEKGIFFKSITEPFIDTTENSPHSKFIINMFAILAELERDIIVERTKAGLESARRRGKIIGRPEGLNDEAKRKMELCAYYFNEGKLTVKEICKVADVSRATYYKYLRLKGLNDKLRPYTK